MEDLRIIQELGHLNVHLQSSTTVTITNKDNGQPTTGAWDKWNFKQLKVL